MNNEIKTIKMKIYGGLAEVNCYLIKQNKNFILIDTGPSNKRSFLFKELEKADCKPGNLRLIIITHGDSDHTGNAAYLREKYGSKIAMHPDDLGMVEKGDMSFNRNTNLLARLLFMLPFVKLKNEDRFHPDLYLEDGQSLEEYDYNAHIIYLPGHSKGSIGIISQKKELFCGDIFSNIDKPVLNNIMDDDEAAQKSINKLSHLSINIVYPGHGKPFHMDQIGPTKK